jgi:hypothetical protein
MRCVSFCTPGNHIPGKQYDKSDGEGPGVLRRFGRIPHLREADLLDICNSGWLVCACRAVQDSPLPHLSDWLVFSPDCINRRGRLTAGVEPLPGGE